MTSTYNFPSSGQDVALPCIWTVTAIRRQVLVAMIGDDEGAK